MPGLTQECFDKLLAAFDPDRDRAGEEYERIRFKLIKLFEWERSKSPDTDPDPDADADKTFDRVCRKIEEGVNIQNLAGYCCGVARHIVQENRRHIEKYKMESIDGMNVVIPSPPPTEDDDGEQLEKCFSKCLGELSEGNRIFIVKYYEGERGDKIANRKKMADELGISLVALRSRARHIRERIEDCVNECLKKI